VYLCTALLRALTEVTSTFIYYSTKFCVSLCLQCNRQLSWTLTHIPLSYLDETQYFAIFIVFSITM